MTTLEDWEREINADPENAMLRLVFADWLQDSDDPELAKLADGIRAFAECGRVPSERYYSGDDLGYWWWNQNSVYRRSQWGSGQPRVIMWQSALVGICVSYFAAFMFAARVWPEFDQKKFYEDFGPKTVEVTR